MAQKGTTNLVDIQLGKVGVGLILYGAAFPPENLSWRLKSKVSEVKIR
jgi:hypothetical protein